MNLGDLWRTPKLPRIILWASVVAFTMVCLHQSGALYQPVGAQTNGQPPGTATLTIFTSLTSPAGQPVAGPLAGYTYTLAGQNGLPSQTMLTNPVGQAVFFGLSAGIYSISESPLAGSSFSSMTINGVSALQQQPFQIQAGGNYNVNVTNTINGPTNLSIQVQVVDQTGQALTTASLSGYSFTLAGPSGSPTTVSSNASGQANTNLPPGAYTITESAAPGATLLSYTINGVPTQTGQFTLGAGQSTTILATNRAVNQSPGAVLRVVGLIPGCNNVVDTYPDGTTGAIFASAVVPATNVTSIWRYDNSAQAFRAAYFASTGAGIPPPLDVSALSRLDPIFICVSAPATLNEPSA
ncbi:MAG TPA: prealbumin-like fold domain-containing protein [Dehalococcoidia bacterium]|nr:prealbumin-like fold domain-containing protein [Dehalococcoidia bacterium]